jgi:hypothetical protein
MNDVVQYFDYDSISKLNISKIIKDDFKNINKKCYYSNKGNTHIGKLIGLEINSKLYEYYYIILGLDNKYHYRLTELGIKFLQ